MSEVTLPRWWRSYERQEYMTPGVVEAMEIARRMCDLKPGNLVIEVAYGKAEAACQMAMQRGLKVVGVDTHDAAWYGRQKAEARRLADRVSFVRGTGRQLPVSDGQFDMAFCTGAPSIAGGAESLAEMHRALRPGGWLVVSDWVWRKSPVPAAAVPRSAGPKAAEQFGLLEEYAATIRSAGFEVLLAETLPASVWEGYYGPMLEVLAERRRSGNPDEIAAAQSSWENEPMVFYEGLGREYWGYGVFVGRKLT